VRKSFLIVLVCLLFLAGCRSEGELHSEEGGLLSIKVPIANAESFALVMEPANERRRNMERPDEERLLEMTRGRTPSMDNINMFREGNTRQTSVPLADAAEDAKDFFRLLRDIYGGYVYFGGDAVFLPILDNIIAEINSFGSGNISANRFEEILFNHLSAVIADNHFMIGRQRFSPNVSIFRATNQDFLYKDGFFVNIRTGRQLANISDFEINDMMRLHINPEGAFVYNPIILQTGTVSANRFSVEFIYTDGTRENVTFDIKRTTPKGHSAANLQHIDGFPVVTIRQMGFPESTAPNMDAANAQAFLSFAEELRGEPVVIMDLRSNMGGNITLASRWLYLLTGKIITQNHVGIRAMCYDSFNILYVYEASPADEFYIPADIIRRHLMHEPFGEGYTVLNNSVSNVVEREQLMIFLVDRFTASAGESFADLALSMTNTLIVGTNTAGILKFDFMFPDLTMPRTGITFGLGTTLFVYSDENVAEGMGIKPDVWVEGDALGAVIAMLRNVE